MTASENNINVLIADSQFLITESLKYILQDDVRFHDQQCCNGKKGAHKRTCQGKYFFVDN